MTGSQRGPAAFASDFDGTLYFMRAAPGERFRRADLLAIERFRAGGGLFGLSTGRSLTGVDMATAELDEPPSFDFYILASGALVLDARRRPLRVSRVGRDAVLDIVRFCEPRAQIVIQANDTVYTFGPPLPMQVHIDTIDEVGDDVYGVSMHVGDPAGARGLAADINGRFGDQVEAFPNASNIDVAPRGCSKGTALRFLRERLGIGRLAAMGDSFNDVPMFAGADFSFTLASSPEQVRRAATHVVGGVAEALGVFGV